MSDKPHKCFFDTNTLVYTLATEGAKTLTARRLLDEGGIVSVQILNEFTSVCRRKLKLPWPKVHRALAAFRDLCEEVVPLTINTHEAALRIAERYGYHIYDSLIIASAIQSGCDVLYSEDMQDGQRIENLEIRNPFR